MCVCLIILSSPYLLVFGDDRVTCYTRADDVVGDTSDTYGRSGAIWGIYIEHFITSLFISYIMAFMIWKFGNIDVLVLILNYGAFNEFKFFSHFGKKLLNVEYLLIFIFIYLN